MVSEEVLKILFGFVKREWPYCYCYCVNFIFTLREPNVYKPHGFFFGFLATFICFCVTVLFHRYLYFVVNQIKLQSYKVTNSTIALTVAILTPTSPIDINVLTRSALVLETKDSIVSRVTNLNNKNNVSKPRCLRYSALFALTVARGLDDVLKNRLKIFRRLCNKTSV